MDQVNKTFFDAAAAGEVAKVSAMIAQGADVNVANGDGRTALMRSDLCFFWRGGAGGAADALLQPFHQLRSCKGAGSCGII